MKKAGISGHFGLGLNMLNGQTIKTRVVTEELKRRLGEEQVAIVDTHGGAKAMPRMLMQLWKLFQSCETVTMLPAYKGLRFFTPVFSFYNLFFHRKLQYVVIGGWLSSFIDRHRWLSGMLKRFDCIFVETTTMKSALEKKGFHNVTVMPNFKKLPILRSDELNDEVEKPYKLCTFSRVMKEKGIEDAVAVVTHINEAAGYTVYCLDIYGQIDSKYEEAFEELQKSFPEYISYKGKVPYEKSVDTLKEYFALLFPTRFYTEGIPGTVIDAYAAGVPIISARWESFADVIDENLTGIGYELLNNEELIKILLNIAEHPEIIVKMKRKCLIKAKKFTPDAAIQKILKEMDR